MSLHIANKKGKNLTSFGCRRLGLSSTGLGTRLIGLIAFLARLGIEAFWRIRVIPTDTNAMRQCQSKTYRNKWLTKKRPFIIEVAHAAVQKC